MATIKYQVKENTVLGTHSFYAQAVSYNTLDIADLAAEIAEGLGISPVMVQTIIQRYAIVATRNVLRGHRVKLGDLLTFYPQISASVKDTVDTEGNVIKKATADMLSVVGCKSSIGATVSQAVQQQFAAGVQWKRVGDDAAVAKANDTGGGASESSDNGSTPGGATDSSASGNAASSSVAGGNE